MATIPAEAEVQNEFPCIQCGASLVFAPGTTSLVCQHCGTENCILLGQDVEPVSDSDYLAALDELAHGDEFDETLTVKCSRCGAETTLPTNVTAKECAFCGVAIVAKQASRKLIRPGFLLPFHISREHAYEKFRAWIASRWFAPSSLRDAAQTCQLSGIYMPAWTYRCDTNSRYTGMRGDDYWVTQTYRSNGKTHTRMVRHTRWRHASGRVDNAFRDLLVRASNSLPESYFHCLEPWDLKQLTAFRNEYLAGFISESYQIDVKAGFEHAKEDMAAAIKKTVCRDIGGDHQRIHQVSTNYSNIGYKHILLPLWLSAYRYHDKSYRFMVNARTGKIRGERPYSFWKIFAAIAVAIVITAIIALIANAHFGGARFH